MEATPISYSCSQNDNLKAWASLSSFDFKCNDNEFLYEFVPVADTFGNAEGIAYYYKCCEKTYYDGYTYSNPVKFESYAPLKSLETNPSLYSKPQSDSSPVLAQIAAVFTIVVGAIAFIAGGVVFFFEYESLKSSKSSSDSASISISSSSSADQYLTTVKYNTIAPITQRYLDDRITVSDIYYPTTAASSVLQKCE